MLNVFIDPYEIFVQRDRPGKLQLLAEKAHYPLWKLSQYEPGKFETVVLGDSRARALRDKYWESLHFTNTKNLAYGGGTIPEIYETFKFIKNDPVIKNLVIGIQLRSFDEDHKQGMNRVPEAISLIENPVDYVFNWSVAKTSFDVAQAEYPNLATLAMHGGLSMSAVAAVHSRETLVLDSLYAAKTPQRELPDRFARQITRNAKSDWQRFEFSEKYWEYIAEIGEWARTKDKRIIFVIPPTIVEMQQTISNFGLRHVDIELRKRLSQYGIVLDLDYPDSLTRDIGNFTDAYHFNAPVAREIAGEIVARLSADSRVQKTVKKRRKSLDCNTPPLDERIIEVDENIVLVQGKNCRTWRLIDG